jgi:N-hydroxyarylamine O-acetyltransferase
MTALDIDAYLERIHWRGEVGPTFDTLAGLLDAHMTHIPFENLDVLLGRPISLDLSALERKLVRARRGGYCFEHATLFAAVLEKLGFKPVRHSARVTLFEPRTVSGRTHMFLSVSIGRETVVIDPGFGLQAPRLPIPLVENTDAGHTIHCMVRDGDYWLLRFQRGAASVNLWASTLEPDNPSDFKIANHYTATHPDSPFVNQLMMRALIPDGFVAVKNRDVTVWQYDDTPHTRQLADRADLRALLVEHFGFDLPEVERMRVPSIPEWG